jgi:hypothetical protein
MGLRRPTGTRLWQAVRFPALAAGVHWLTSARVGAVRVARAYARIHWVPAEFSTQCLFCDDATMGETLPHLLVECPRWEVQRAPLQPLVDEARDRLGAAAVTVDNVALYLLGGEGSVVTTRAPRTSGAGTGGNWVVVAAHRRWEMMAWLMACYLPLQCNSGRGAARCG